VALASLSNFLFLTTFVHFDAIAISIEESLNPINSRPNVTSQIDLMVQMVSKSRAMDMRPGYAEERPPHQRIHDSDENKQVINIQKCRMIPKENVEHNGCG
jgi:hypothetical protein